MPDDLDDDFVPDFDDSFVIELEQPALPAVALKKRKRREKEQQSKVHSLFFIFFLVYHLLEKNKAHKGRRASFGLCR